MLCAVVAQLAEQLIRNEQVAGSIPVNGSTDLDYEKILEDITEHITRT